MDDFLGQDKGGSMAKRKARIDPSITEELEVLRQLAELFERLDDPAKQRAILWLSERFDICV